MLILSSILPKELDALDVGAILAAVAAMLLPAIILGFLHKGTASLGGFILGGRKLPWWLGGATMVAGGTNADSALHQSGKIRRDGLAGAWFYWSQIFGAIWHSLVFSRLWRRLEINTAIEFYDVRYAGKGSSIGRVWSMLFSSLVESVVGLALGLIAMIKICEVFFAPDAVVPVFGLPIPFPLLVAVTSVTLGILYSIIAGLVGVVAGDMIEFVLAIVGSYVLMYHVYGGVGFHDGLRSGLAAIGKPQLLSFIPIGTLSFVVLLLVQPFATVSGNASLNQRFLAMRDEKQAMFSGFWRVISAYFIRGWPWYICGLCSLLLLPVDGHSSESTYPWLIAHYLPHGWRGFVLSSLIITFMGAVGTLMHNFGSVFVNDFYRIHVHPGASQRHYVWVMRLTMLLTATIATAIALSSDRILALLEVILIVAAASGTVLLLRWHWWRVNAWADITAQALSLPLTLAFSYGPGAGFVRRAATALHCGSEDGVYALTFLITVVSVTVAWVLVMYLTKPEPMPKLKAFYAKARPYGFWRPVADLCPEVSVTDRFGTDLQRYGLGVGASLGCLFGLGALFLGMTVAGFVLLTVGSLLGVALIRSIQRSQD